MARHGITINDFETVEREYWIEQTNYVGEVAKPSPVLLVFHGQGGNASNIKESHTFGKLGADSNLLVVYPQGIDDSSPGGTSQGTGWNVGSGGDNATCVPAGVGDQYGCYNSCRKQNKCGRCNWSTCYDDVLYVKSMLAEVAEEFCIDLDRIYAQGESNGAMMVHHLVRELPYTFAGYTAWFGIPLLGYLLGDKLSMITPDNALAKTSYLALHDRSDTCIPVAGGVSDAGWLYEPLVDSTGIWAVIHNCDRYLTPIKTRWDGGKLNFSCGEHLHCASGRRVVQCLYDGQHGDYPLDDHGDEIVLSVLLENSRQSAVTSGHYLV